MIEKTLFSHLLVLLQLIGMTLAVWPGAWAWHQGFLIIDGGIALGVWVLWHNRLGNFSIYPEPISKAKLIITGPYNRIRHPMYAALLLVIFGIAFVQGALMNLTGAALVLTVVMTKIPREERFLNQVFPDYQAYSQRTYRLLPGVF